MTELDNFRARSANEPTTASRCTCTVTRHERMLNRQCPTHGDDAELEREFDRLIRQAAPEVRQAVRGVLEALAADPGRN